MKKTIIAALAFAAFSASAFDAPQQVKQAWAAETIKQTEAMPLEEFCRIKGVMAFDLEGTAPASIERAIDYGMMEAYFVKARKWSDTQKTQCATLEVAAYRDAAEEAGQ